MLMAAPLFEMKLECDSNYGGIRNFIISMMHFKVWKIIERDSIPGWSRQKHLSYDYCEIFKIECSTYDWMVRAYGLLLNEPLPASFYLFKQYTVNMFIVKFCLYTNREPLVLKAIALPTMPQPLPWIEYFNWFESASTWTKKRPNKGHAVTWSSMRAAQGQWSTS